MVHFHRLTPCIDHIWIMIQIGWLPYRVYQSHSIYSLTQRMIPLMLLIICHMSKWMIVQRGIVSIRSKLRGVRIQRSRWRSYLIRRCLHLSNPQMIVSPHLIFPVPLNHPLSLILMSTQTHQWSLVEEPTQDREQTLSQELLRIRSAQTRNLMGVLSNSMPSSQHLNLNSTTWARIFHLK